MTFKRLIATAILSIAVALFFRFGIAAYTRLFILSHDILAAWAIGAALFVTVKATQLSPLLLRSGIFTNISKDLLSFLSLLVTPIDIIISLRAYPWGQDIENLLLSIGCIGWSGLVRAIVLQWVSFDSVTAKIADALNTPTLNRSIQLEGIGISGNSRSKTPSDREFVSQLIPKVASLFIAGLSGSGKDFVGSLLCAYLQSEFGAKIFFVDPKNDPNEHLWDNADYQYRFSGTMMEPDEFLSNLKKAFRQYGERLEENGSGQYTILVLNELATCATKCDNSSDKKWLSATLQPMLSGLDSAGGCVMVLTQTLIMPTGFNSGTVSQFQKLIICRQEQIENLSTQSKTVLMSGVDLSGATDACEMSPVDRAIYSSSLRKWLPLPKMRQGESYYCRDSRQWIGQVIDRSPQPSPVDNLVLEYFNLATPDRPKTLKHLRDSSRFRDRVPSTDIEASLDRLTSAGKLRKDGEGWVSVEW